MNTFYFKQYCSLLTIIFTLSITDQHFFNVKQTGIILIYSQSGMTLLLKYYLYKKVFMKETYKTL